MNYSNIQIQDMVKKILENDFETNKDLTLMYLKIGNQIIELNDSELETVMGYKGCTVKQRWQIAKGISAEEFYNRTNTFHGYKVFDLEIHPEYTEGAFIEDTGKHGIYFTIKREELFRFIMASYYEKFGTYIAEISLKYNSQFVENAAITKGFDTEGTYRSHCFYIEKIYSINDYKLIHELFTISPEHFKRLIIDDSENSFYQQSIKYFTDKGCADAVAALIDIHNTYHL